MKKNCLNILADQLILPINGLCMTFITTLLKKKLILNCYLLTDSLTYEIKLEDVYEEFVKHKHLFDLKNYPKESKIFDPVNEKVIGKMKDLSQ